MNTDEIALSLIETWESGQYQNDCQKKAALQVLITQALQAQHSDARRYSDALHAIKNFTYLGTTAEAVAIATEALRVEPAQDGEKTHANDRHHP